MQTLVPGLTLYPDFIDLSMEEKLIQEIDASTWVVDYDRRLQYYGYRNELEKPYDLVAFPVPLPALIRQLSEEVVARKLMVSQPDQVIINEYLPGQGLRPHKDRNYFENQICGVNLGSGCIMQFIKGKEQKIDVPIPRRSLYVIQDEARYKWMHAIPPRKKDNIDGTLHHRERRLSITYRKVRADKVKPLRSEGKVAWMLREFFNIG